MTGLECPSANAVTAWRAIVPFTRLRMFYEGCVYYQREIQQFIGAYTYQLMRVFLNRLTQPHKHVLTSNIRIRHVWGVRCQRKLQLRPSPAFRGGRPL